jgi:hypothetical protein
VIALSPDPMLHDGLIAAHALSGVVAFALGAVLAPALDADRTGLDLSFYDISG